MYGLDNVRNLQIGLLGLGTVGTGVVKTLQENQRHIFSQSGISIQLKKILVKDIKKQRKVEVDARQLTTDGKTIVSDPEISIVIEVMGGMEPAFTLVKGALEAGKHVVTANKELLAKRGQELLQLAADHRVHLLYEASVGGGIPVIRTLQAYLSANRVSSLRGILNGTCNYILTQMAEHGSSFASALAQAQQSGFAEADPTSDVEGFDASYKLLLLANMAFPLISFSPADVQRQGISEVNAVDMLVAKQFNSVIKLIAQGSYNGNAVALNVGPRMIPWTDSLATIRDEFNAVVINADVAGDLMLVGKGAGERPTASAVIEDVMVILQSDFPRSKNPIEPWIPKTPVSNRALIEDWSYLRIKIDTPQEMVMRRDAVQQLVLESQSVREPVILNDKDQYSGYLLAFLPLSVAHITAWGRAKQLRDWIVMPYEGAIFESIS